MRIPPQLNNLPVASHMAKSEEQVIEKQRKQDLKT